MTATPSNWILCETTNLRFTCGVPSIDIKSSFRSSVITDKIHHYASSTVETPKIVPLTASRHQAAGGHHSLVPLIENMLQRTREYVTENVTAAIGRIAGIRII